jgi:hemoglobin
VTALFDAPSWVIALAFTAPFLVLLAGGLWLICRDPHPQHGQHYAHQPPARSTPTQQETPPMTSTAPAADVPLWQRLRYQFQTDEVTHEVARRLYRRILGPRGTDPGETGDPQLVPYFRRPDGTYIDRDRLERHMSHFLMAALGGPRKYTGRGMAATHGHLGITDAAFDQVLWHVVQVLRELAVPDEWIGEVGAAVAPLRPAIVTAPTAPAPATS